MITREIVIWCDHAEGAPCDAYLETQALYAATARDYARNVGWQRTNRKDYCPEHRRPGARKEQTNG